MNVKNRGSTKKVIKISDFIKKNKEDLNSGLAVEQLIVEHERRYLFDLGLNELAEKVR